MSFDAESIMDHHNFSSSEQLDYFAIQKVLKLQKNYIDYYFNKNNGVEINGMSNKKLSIILQLSPIFSWVIYYPINY